MAAFIPHRITIDPELLRAVGRELSSAEDSLGALPAVVPVRGSLGAMGARCGSRARRLRPAERASRRALPRCAPARGGRARGRGGGRSSGPRPTRSTASDTGCGRNRCAGGTPREHRGTPHPRSRDLGRGRRLGACADRERAWRRRAPRARPRRGRRPPPAACDLGRAAERRPGPTRRRRSALDATRPRARGARRTSRPRGRTRRRPRRPHVDRRRRSTPRPPRRRRARRGLVDGRRRRDRARRRARRGRAIERALRARRGGRVRPRRVRSHVRARPDHPARTDRDPRRLPRRPGPDGG